MGQWDSGTRSVNGAKTFKTFLFSVGYKVYFDLAAVDGRGRLSYIVIHCHTTCHATRVWDFVVISTTRERCGVGETFVNSVALW